MEIAKSYYFNNNPNIEFMNDKYTALDNVDALILITEWKEFRSPDFDEMSKRIKRKIIFDGRN
jgi:UDPglucose 6-dehydrogenase